MGVLFKTELKQFGSQGEKTGWTYILVPRKIATKLKPGIKKSFRVKGIIDDHLISGVAMIPMGEGDFIIAVNASMRKALRKQKGALVVVKIEEDLKEYQILAEFLNCLQDEPSAYSYFNTLLPSHQRYFSKWIESAKTEVTRTKRIAMSVNAMVQKIDFGQMLRDNRKWDL
jgi:hypothetical protein